MEPIYIGREDERNILSYVDLTILRNFISRFTELSIDILTNSITFFFNLVKYTLNGEKVSYWFGEIYEPN